MALLEASGIGKNFGETKVLKDSTPSPSSRAGTGIIALRLGQATLIATRLNFLSRRHRRHVRYDGDAEWSDRPPDPRRPDGPGTDGGRVRNREKRPYRTRTVPGPVPVPVPNR